jgi:hypothetical protein
VDQNNRIDVTRPIVFNGSVTITVPLEDSEFNRINNLVTSGQCRLNVLQVQTSGGNQGQVVLANGCSASLQSNGMGGGSLVLTGTCSGQLIVVCGEVHLQGSVGG